MFNLIIFALTLFCINSYGMELVPRSKSDSTLPSMILNTQKEQQQILVQTAARRVRNRLGGTDIALAIGVPLFISGITDLAKGMYNISHISAIINSHEVCIPEIPFEAIEEYAQCVSGKAFPCIVSGVMLCVPYGVKKCFECCKDEKED